MSDLRKAAQVVDGHFKSNTVMAPWSAIPDEALLSLRAALAAEPEPGETVSGYEVKATTAHGGMLTSILARNPLTGEEATLVRECYEEPEPGDDGNGKLARLREILDEADAIGISKDWKNCRAWMRGQIDHLKAEPAQPDPGPARPMPVETFAEPPPPRIAIFIRDRDGHATMARIEQVEWSNTTNCWAYTVRHPDNTVPHGVAYGRQECEPAPSEDEIEAAEQALHAAMLSLDHSWDLPDAQSCKPFGQHEKHRAVRSAIDEIVAIARRLREGSEADRAAARAEAAAADEFRDRVIEALRERDAAIAERDKWSGMAVELEQVGALFDLQGDQTILDAVECTIAAAEKAEARVAGLDRAVKALLRARGTDGEGFSVTLLKDDDGYFEVHFDRGVVRVEALLAKAEGS